MSNKLTTAIVTLSLMAIPFSSMASSSTNSTADNVLMINLPSGWTGTSYITGASFDCTPKIRSKNFNSSTNPNPVSYCKEIQTKDKQTSDSIKWTTNVTLNNSATTLDVCKYTITTQCDKTPKSTIRTCTTKEIIPTTEFPYRCTIMYTNTSQTKSSTSSEVTITFRERESGLPIKKSN